MNLFRRLAAGTAVALLWGLTMSVHAASFNCASAKQPQELLICADYRLSDLDSQLARVYQEALQNSKDQAELQVSQKAWLAARRQCRTFDCIQGAYVTRLAQLAPATEPVHPLVLPEQMP